MLSFAAALEAFTSQEVSCEWKMHAELPELEKHMEKHMMIQNP